MAVLHYVLWIVRIAAAMLRRAASLLLRSVATVVGTRSQISQP